MRAESTAYSDRGHGVPKRAIPSSTAPSPARATSSRTAPARRILTNTNIYAGATTIKAGTLQVDSSIASPNVTVNADVTLSPGNPAQPYGTLTIYDVAITSMANSRANVVGATTIAGGNFNGTAGSSGYAMSTKRSRLSRP